jgi:hypothetical protein
MNFLFGALLPLTAYEDAIYNTAYVSYPFVADGLGYRKLSCVTSYDFMKFVKTFSSCVNIYIKVNDLKTFERFVSTRELLDGT